MVFLLSFETSSCAKPEDDGGTGSGGGGGINNGNGNAGSGGSVSDRCKDFDRKKVRGCGGFNWRKKSHCYCR